MTLYRALPALCRILIPALLVVINAPVVAQSPPPASTRTTVDIKPPAAVAQTQIARLRQTAQQLRLLAFQPKPANIAATEYEEYEHNQQWLREAQHRVHTLAENWEQRLAPATGNAATARLRDVNAFFTAQTVGLQSRLERESAEKQFTSATVRAARDTARVVIGQMN